MDIINLITFLSSLNWLEIVGAVTTLPRDELKNGNQNGSSGVAFDYVAFLNELVEV